MGSFPNLLSLTIISIGRSLFAGIMNLLSIVQQPKNWQKSSLVSLAFEPVVGENRKVQQVNAAVAVEVATDLLP